MLRIFISLILPSFFLATGYANAGNPVLHNDVRFRGNITYITGHRVPENIIKNHQNIQTAGANCIYSSGAECESNCEGICVGCFGGGYACVVVAQPKHAPNPDEDTDNHPSGSH